MWNISEDELQELLRRNPALRTRETVKHKQKESTGTVKIPRSCLTESEEQILLFQWAEAMTGQYPDLAYLFHIPNGGKRSRGTAGRLKAEGVKAGVPDLRLPVARGGWFGLYIEMKAQGGRTSKVQREWLEHLRDKGYVAVVCIGWEEASAALTEYLNLLPTEIKE